MTPSEQTLVVSGASRGLGAFIADRATEQGFNVVGLARTERLDGSFPIIGCDVGDAAAVSSAARQIRKMGAKPLYGVINAAGIASMNLAISTPDETIQRILNTNLVGTINMAKSFAKPLIKSGGGRIINFSTIAVTIALAGESVYASSKAAVETFSRCFAREVAPHGITVNCIAPGPIDTDLIAKVPSDKIQEIVDQQIFQTKAHPDDVWNITQLLLDPKANMISGEIINVGGA
ncbi:MAG: SDR family oxidoreductase [Pseudomonadota bacterium]